ncbi:MAG: ComEC/Rec2 family competence protein [bacterium]|nr:ComEC/Rec2 family competence protein [bacterium]
MDRKVSIDKILVFIFSFLLAVLVSSFVHIPPLVSLFIILVGSAVVVSDKIWNGEMSIEVLLVSLVIVSFGLGALRYEVKDFHVPLAPASTGVVITEPEERENTTRFVLFADNGEKVLVSTDLYSSVEYGDRVEVKGKLQEPGVIDDGIGRPFDYAQYLSKDDIYQTMSFAGVKVLSHGEGNPIKQALFKIKHSLVGKIREVFAEPESSLLAGLIVAGKAAMPKSILEEFRRAGVIHIVVLSGYNITIIAEFLRKMFENIFLKTGLGARLPAGLAGPKMALGSSIAGIVFFVLATGAEPAVVRAAIMVLVVISAKMFGRTYSAPRALLGAAFLMILYNPKILVFDPSFQLSFLATCALIYVVPMVEKYLKWITESWGIRTMVAATVATQFTVLPYLVYSMGEVSLVALLANVLILLLIPVTMFTGFAAAVTAYLSPVIVWPIAFVPHLLLSWILGVSHFLGNLSFASISVSVFPLWAAILAYLLLIVIIARSRGYLHKFAS